jgi:hypothetical protein
LSGDVAIARQQLRIPLLHQKIFAAPAKSRFRFCFVLALVFSTAEMFDSEKIRPALSWLCDLVDCEAAQRGVALRDIKSQAARGQSHHRDHALSDPAIDRSKADLISIGQFPPRNH